MTTTAEDQLTIQKTTSITTDQWKQKQELAKPGRYYGDGGTIHSTGEVNVELDGDGHVD